MRNNVVQLDRVEHANLKIIDRLDLEQFTQGIMVPISIHEVAQLSTELPLVFLKNPESGDFSLVAIMGIEPKQNLMVKNGAWTGHFMPAMFAFAPLGIANHPTDPNQVVIVINMDSDCLSETEGEALFDGQQQATAFLTSRTNSMVEFKRNGQITRDFTETLVELNLLEIQDFKYEQKDSEKAIRGIYLVTQEKMNQLSAESLAVLQRKGYLGAIYQHIASMFNFNKLIAVASQE